MLGLDEQEAEDAVLVWDSHIQRLPAEIVVGHIFPLLDAHQVNAACPLVCKEWLHFSRTNTLWKSLCRRDFALTLPPPSSSTTTTTTKLKLDWHEQYKLLARRERLVRSSFQLSAEEDMADPTLVRITKDVEEANRLEQEEAQRALLRRLKHIQSSSTRAERHRARELLLSMEQEQEQEHQAQEEEHSTRRRRNTASSRRALYVRMEEEEEEEEGEEREDREEEAAEREGEEEEEDNDEGEEVDDEEEEDFQLQAERVQEARKHFELAQEQGKKFLCATYLAEMNPLLEDTGDLVGACQCTHPIMPLPIANARLAYFEVRIENAGATCTIGVGLAKQGYALLYAQPGWQERSYGWHGDDGRLFIPSIPIGIAWSDCITWSNSDVVGCGYDYLHKEIFYTWNGQYLGTAFSNVQNVRSYHATIGMNCTNAQVTVNFGAKPFLYDLTTYPKLGDGFTGVIVEEEQRNTKEKDEEEDATGEEDEEPDSAAASRYMLKLLENAENIPSKILESDVQSMVHVLGLRQIVSNLTLNEKIDYLREIIQLQLDYALTHPDDEYEIQVVHNDYDEDEEDISIDDDDEDEDWTREDQAEEDGDGDGDHESASLL
ncbi:ATPase family AAA domain-containing protein 2 isoform X2 [Balamuthia mandrillaris]